MTKAGFSGTRLGMTSEQRNELVRQLHKHGITEFHHGDCVGSDEQADQVCVELGIRRVAHPPTGSGLRARCDCEVVLEPAEFLVRNRAIVLTTEILFATPDLPERRRSGTWSTIRFARRNNLPVIVILPLGNVLVA